MSLILYRGETKITVKNQDLTELLSFRLHSADRSLLATWQQYAVVQSHLDLEKNHSSIWCNRVIFNI